MILTERFRWKPEDVVIVRAPVIAGGAGSGNFGHAGRPGEVGGSSGALDQSSDEPGISDKPGIAPRGTE